MVGHQKSVMCSDLQFKRIIVTSVWGADRPEWKQRSRGEGGVAVQVRNKEIYSEKNGSAAVCKKWRLRPVGSIGSFRQEGLKPEVGLWE